MVTVHIDGVVGLIAVIAGLAGVLVYRWTVPSTPGIPAPNRGERLTGALVAVLTMIGILSFVLFGVAASGGQAPQYPNVQPTVTASDPAGSPGAFEAP